MSEFSIHVDIIILMSSSVVCCLGVLTSSVIVVFGWRRMVDRGNSLVRISPVVSLVSSHCAVSKS
jgi:hypothetical protein